MKGRTKINEKTNLTFNYKNEGIMNLSIPGQSTTNESSITLQVEPFRNFELKDDFRTCSIASSPTESSGAQIALRYNSLIHKI